LQITDLANNVTGHQDNWFNYVWNENENRIQTTIYKRSSGQY